MNGSLNCLFWPAGWNGTGRKIIEWTAFNLSTYVVPRLLSADASIALQAIEWEQSMSGNRSLSRPASGQKYQAPKLTVFGEAIHLTASGTSSTGEGKGGGNVKRI